MDDGNKNTPSSRQVEARFYRHLVADRQFSESAIGRYRRWLHVFWLQLEADGRDWSEADVDDATDFVAALQRQGYSPSTIGHAISCMRTFYSWAVGRRLIGHNPFALVRRPKENQRLPRYLTQEQMRRLLEVAARGAKPKEIADRALLEALYSSGMRVSELCGLNLDDVDLQEGWAIVKGKGGHEGKVYLSPSACAAIRAYLRWVRPLYVNGHQTQALFVSIHGERLRRQQVAEALLRLTKKAGIEVRVTPHMIRHSIATHLLENGADVRYVQEFLRHKRLATTQIYTHVAPVKLREVVLRCHPLAQAD